MYVRTSFRGANSCKIREKLLLLLFFFFFFCQFYKFGKGYDGKIRENMQKRVIRVFLKKYVLMVFQKKSYYEDDTPVLQVPPGASSQRRFFFSLEIPTTNLSSLLIIFKSINMQVISNSSVFVTKNIMNGPK